jgi:hypothetical protein
VKPTKALLAETAKLLTDVCRHVRRYVALGENELRAIALWTIHTHALDAAEVTPYLNITSAEKQCGKTRLLEVLELLVYKPWFTGRTTAAALARRVHEGATLLLDETDAAFNGDRDYAENLRGILNTGHRKKGSTTLCVGKGAELSAKQFSVFGAKALAGIGNSLPDTIRDRSILIWLKRRAENEDVYKFRLREVVPISERLKERVEQWATANTDRLKGIEPIVIDEISDRAFDGWEPLLAIAELAGPEWLAKANKAARLLSHATGTDNESNGVRLLRDIRGVFQSLSVNQISTVDLLSNLSRLQESPWGSHDGKPMSPRALARILKPFEIGSRQLWENNENKHGYVQREFADAWRRYLRDHGESARTARNARASALESAAQVTLENEESSEREAGNLFGNRSDLADLASAGGMPAGLPVCSFHQGRPGESCGRCDNSWEKHTSIN